MSHDGNESYPMFLSRLEQNVLKYSSKTAVGFLSPGADGGNLQKSMTYKELSAETSKIASFLIEKGLKKGDR